MNLAQKALQKISAMNKKQAPVSMHSQGGPNFGGYGSFGSSGVGAGAKWLGGIPNTGQGLTIKPQEMRINARSAYHDSTQARAVVDRYADIVVDVGLKLAPTPSVKLLGLTDEQGEAWSERIAEKFHLYMSSKQCMSSEKMTGYQAQRLYEIQKRRDGDMFTRLYYNTRPGLASPLQFDFIDPSQIKGQSYTSTLGFDVDINDGIKRDEYGREIGYTVWAKDGKGGFKDEYIPAVGKSGRIHMLHGFNPEYASQGRGYSTLGHALQEFQSITDFSLATIQKAINQSQITMFVEPSQDEDAVNPFEGITDNYGPSVSQYGSDPTPPEGAQNVAIEDIRGVEYCPVPTANFGVPGSTGVFNLPKGSKLAPFPNSAPGDSFDSFVDAFTSHLSSSMGMPQEVLLMKFGSNYSASRGALILFWRVAQIERAEIDADLMAPIYEMWLSEEIASGRETAFGWSDPGMRQAWLSHDLIGTAIPNIDDKKAAQANEINLKINSTDLDRVAFDTNGSNGKANRSKLKRQTQEVAQMPWEKNENA